MFLILEIYGMVFFYRNEYYQTTIESVYILPLASLVAFSSSSRAIAQTKTFGFDLKIVATQKLIQFPTTNIILLRPHASEF